MNAFLYAKLIKLMLSGTLTCQELADEIGLHYVTVLHYTRELHREGAAHIAEFHADTNGRDMIKVYKIGPGKDAKRSRMTVNERKASSRATQKDRASNLRTAMSAFSSLPISDHT